MKIITLCGSMKFQNEMTAIAEKMALQGDCVLTPLTPARADRRDYTQEELAVLGQMHREKIKLSDAILVVNVNGYIGSSTTREIEYARSLHKEILYYTDWINESCREED